MLDCSGAAQEGEEMSVNDFRWAMTISFFIIGLGETAYHKNTTWVAFAAFGVAALWCPR